MPLTDIAIRALKEPGRYFDGNGLYLEFSSSGGKYWRLKYRFGGKEKRLALGVYPEVSLSEARKRKDEARRLMQQGVDPSSDKKEKKVASKFKSANTFENVARDWLDHMGNKWDPITKTRALASLEANIFPALGTRPIAEINVRELTLAIQAIEARGASEIAGRVLQRCRSIFRYAVHNGRLDVNPMSELRAGEIIKPRNVKHRAALPQAEVARFLKLLAGYEGDLHTREALHLLVLTAVRPGELRGARWDEFDEEKNQWRIPAERMKMKAEHIVSLSKQAKAILSSMRSITGSGALVFPSPYYPTKPLSENTLNSALARMGYKGIATAHGMRSLFSTVANEEGWDGDVIERQLAHNERNGVRAAYHHSQYLEARKDLMQWWADWLEGKRAVAPQAKRFRRTT